MKHISAICTGIITAALAAGCASEVNSSSEELGSGQQASTSCSAVYGQCGGQNWTGATCCATGSTCTYSNQWYSQCLPGGSGSSSGSSSGGGGSNCPSGATADAQRMAATAAVNVMRANAQYALQKCGQQNQSYGPCWATTILSSQRYKVAAAGAVVSWESWPTIEFDPADPIYPYVDNATKAALVFAQDNQSVASYLVSGLQWAQANTDGTQYAQMIPIVALGQFTYPGNNTPINEFDQNAGQTRRTAVITGTPYCGTQNIHITDQTQYENPFASLQMQSYTMWSQTKNPAFHGGGAYPSTPFNGSGGNNPFLVINIVVDGQSYNWNSLPPAQNCQNSACAGTIDIDPVPYAEPGPYYDTNGNLVGTQSNPFQIVGSLFAIVDHENQWATRTVNGVQEWGIFTTPVYNSTLNITEYKYLKQM